MAVYRQNYLQGREEPYNSLKIAKYTIALSSCVKYKSVLRKWKFEINHKENVEGNSQKTVLVSLV